MDVAKTKKIIVKIRRNKSTILSGQDVKIVIFCKYLGTVITSGQSTIEKRHQSVFTS